MWQRIQFSLEDAVRKRGVSRVAKRSLTAMPRWWREPPWQHSQPTPLRGSWLRAVFWGQASIFYFLADGGGPRARRVVGIGLGGEGPAQVVEVLDLLGIAVGLGGPWGHASLFHFMGSSGAIIRD